MKIVSITAFWIVCLTYISASFQSEIYQFRTIIYYNNFIVAWILLYKIKMVLYYWSIYHGCQVYNTQSIKPKNYKIVPTFTAFINTFAWNHELRFRTNDKGVATHKICAKLRKSHMYGILKLRSLLHMTMRVKYSEHWIGIIVYLTMSL